MFLPQATDASLPLEYCSPFPKGIMWLPCLQIYNKLSSGCPTKINTVFIYLQIVFSKRHDGSSKTLTPARVRLKREIINIALEAGCEPITALGSHQHTCSTVLHCYTFPEVQMSSFTVITLLPPLTIDYLPLQHFEPSCGSSPHGSLYPYSMDQAECPPHGFYSKRGGSKNQRG